MEKDFFARLLALGGVLLLGDVAQGQTPSVPTIPNVNPADDIQVIQNGFPVVGNKYAPVPVITGVHGYKNLGTLATAQTLTFTNAIEYMIAQSSASIAATTLNTSANPGDGQHECFIDLNAVGTLTVVAAVGTIHASVPTAAVAATPVCWIYSAASNTWFSSP